MNARWKLSVNLILSIFFTIFFAACFLQKATAEDASPPDSPSLMPSSLPTGAQAVTSTPLSALQNLGFDHWDSGPFSFAEKYDTLLGMIFSAQYTQKIDQDWAMGVMAEYGPNQYRFNGTLATQLSSDAQMKFSAEYLSQVLPFNFDSGNIHQRVGQSAYGLDLRQNFHGPFLQNLNFGGYWTKAPNVGLPTETFTSNGLIYTNERNIAGSISQGVNVGTGLALSPLTILNAKLFYDSVNYHTQLTSNSTYNNSGLGDSLQLDQILNGRLKFSITAEKRAIYNTYSSELDWKPAFAQRLNTELSLFVQRLASNNQTPSSNTIGLKFSLSDGGPKLANYAPAKPAALSDLLPWVKDPAVYMQRVLVVSEQKTTLNGPVINSITPDSGPLIGGNTVTINGTNFLSGTTVTFNGVNAVVLLVSTTQLSVIVPELSNTVPHASTTQHVQVVVTNPDGQRMVFPQGYTYTDANAPSLTGAAPSSGTTSGGTTVTLTGVRLTGATAVTFGGTAGTDVTVVNDTTVTVVTPAHAAGIVNVAITTPEGTNTLVNGYTYAIPIPAPSLTSLSPSSGSTNGGTSVTLSGTHLTGTTSVTFGGTEATDISVVNDSTVTVNTPLHVEGAVDVVLTTPGGSSTLTNAFTYIAPPTISVVNPNSGYANVNTSVTISGENFSGATAVHFGTTEASSFTVDDPTTISAVSPLGSAGVVDITVTTPVGTSSISSADEFTYVAPPAIIFVTNSSYNGNLGGFSGANAKCNSDTAKPSSGFAKDYTYKALLSGNNATTSGISYYRKDGATFIAMATGGNLVGANPLTHAINSAGVTAWTGATSNCSTWATNNSSSSGTSGLTSSASSAYWSNSTVACNAVRTLYCVSQ